MTGRLATLAAVHAAVWQQLQAATTDRQHPWRTPVLATVDGTGADARTVVLREVDADQRCLLFYSDQRAGKVAQLLSHPEGTLVMWSATLAWQLRCRVQLSLEPPGPATSSRWACIQMSPSAQDYLSPLPPGAPLGDEPAADTAHSSRGHFAVIRAQVTALDWLELHRDGHRRALFSPFGNQHGDANVGRWVQP